MTTSDHIPYVIFFQTSVPKPKVFRFENRLLHMQGFLPLVEQVWTQSIHFADAAKRISAKFKILRKPLKNWAKSFSSLKRTLQILMHLLLSLIMLKIIET
jgi:hypothetical protein